LFAFSIVAIVATMFAYVIWLVSRVVKVETKTHSDQQPITIPTFDWNWWCSARQQSMESRKAPRDG
jgi:hypothetical protein